MSTATQFFGDRVWSPAEIGEAVGEDDDWRRYEIVDGILVVSPHPAPRHELIAKRLMLALDPHVPQGYEALGSMGIVLGRTYRVTDVTVVDNRIFDRDRGSVRPGEVLLAVEIESPSSITTDRVTKPAQYAAAGIAHYWRVEVDPLRLHTYALVGGLYQETGDWSTDETAVVSDPFSAAIDLRALLP